MSEHTDLLPLRSPEEGGPAFELVRRGYDRDQVENHLGWLEDQLRNAEIARDAAEQAAATASADAEAARDELERGRPKWHEFGEHITQILTLAEDQGAEIRAQRVREADELLADARQSAIDTDRDCAARVREAEALAEQITTTARSEAEHLMSTTQAEAARIMQTTQAEASEIMTSTQAEADRVLTRAQQQAAEEERAAGRRLAELERQRDAVNSQLGRLHDALSQALSPAISLQETYELDTHPVPPSVEMPGDEMPGEYGNEYPTDYTTDVTDEAVAEADYDEPAYPASAGAVPAPTTKKPAARTRS